MAAQVLRCYCAHDVRHDLESALWLLLCMVLRHTLQVRTQVPKLQHERYKYYLELFGATTEDDSFWRKRGFITSPRMVWEVKDNAPLNQLILDFKDMVYEQDPVKGPPTPLTYEGVLSAFNRALASPGWPKDDAALPFTLPRDNTNSSQSGSKKRVREEDDTAKDQAGEESDEAGPGLPRRASKRPQVGPSPLRNEVEAGAHEEGDELFL